MKRPLAGFVSALFLLVFAWACVAWRTSYLPGASKAPSTFAMQSSLARPLPTLTFDAVGLADVIDFYRDVSGTNISVDWPALRRAGVDQNQAVSANVRNVSLGEALSTMLATANLEFNSSDEVILIHPAGQTPRLLRTERHPRRGPYAGAMDARIPAPTFSDVSLKDVIDFFTRTHGVPIKVDWDSLRSVGINNSTPVSFNARNISFASALSLILANLTDTDDIQFKLGDEGILIATRSEFDTREVPRPWWRKLHPGLIVAAIIVLGLVLLLFIRRRTVAWSRAAWPALLAAAPAVAFVSALGLGFFTWRHRPPTWEFVHGSARWTLTADHGAVHIYKTPADPATPYRSAHAGVGMKGVLTVKGRWGFYLRQHSWPVESWNLELPVWAVVVLTASAPLGWLWATWSGRKRHKEGKCLQCGYDLRASKDRCPECGGLIRA